MRKCLKKALIFTLAFGMVSYQTDYMATNVKAEQMIKVTGTWQKVNGKYQYPITREDVGWDERASTDERYEVCQIPNNLVKALNTKDLLCLVMECPMLYTIYYHDSFYEGMMDFVERFNGMKELTERKDFYAEVIDYYDSIEIPKEEKSVAEKLLPENPTDEEYDCIYNKAEVLEDIDDSAELGDKIKFCQIILSSMTETASVKDKVKAKKLLISKNVKIQKSKIHSWVLSLSDLTDAEWTDSVLFPYNGEIVLTAAKATKTLKTPGGTKVDFTSIPKENRSPVDNLKKTRAKNDYQQYKRLSDDTPVVTVLGGTKGYNCYNYAWLYNDVLYNHDFWKKGTINNDRPYWKDPYYKKISQSKIQPGDIGVYKGHAVVVVKPSFTYYDSRIGKEKKVTEPLVKSKWSKEGVLAQHPLSIGGFDNSGNVEFFRYSYK